MTHLETPGDNIIVNQTTPWFLHFTYFLQAVVFQASHVDTTPLFLHSHNHTSYMLLYIDDQGGPEGDSNPTVPVQTLEEEGKAEKGRKGTVVGEG
jgi:hypothetical protein